MSNRSRVLVRVCKPERIFGNVLLVVVNSFPESNQVVNVGLKCYVLILYILEVEENLKN